MLFTESGIVTLVSRLQPKNARSPMLVTLSGIVTPVNLSQQANPHLPIFVTLLPSTSDGIAKSPSAFRAMTIAIVFFPVILSVSTSHTKLIDGFTATSLLSNNSGIAAIPPLPSRIFGSGLKSRKSTGCQSYLRSACQSSKRVPTSYQDPESIRKSRTPSAQASVANDALPFGFLSSGAIYRSLPIRTSEPSLYTIVTVAPILFRYESSIIFAIPKSVITARPSRAISMLSSEMSRWTTWWE